MIPKSTGSRFVVQKHLARRLHYDLRLEMEGVMRSWAVPKGPSLDPSRKRLAVMVEDHDLEHADLEGIIAGSKPGTGAVIIWDRGEYEAIDPLGDAAFGIRCGRLDFELYGRKLRGAFTLVRTRPMRGKSAARRQQWLLIKRRDRYARGDDILEVAPRSVVSGRTLEELLDPADASGL